MVNRTSDPWLLLAIVYAYHQKDSSLSNIIGNGDLINHAIFSLQELQGGISRLINSEYVFEKGGQFLPTDKILIPYKKLSGKRNQVSKELEFIRTELKAPKWSENYNPLKANRGGGYKRITKDILEKAYNDYLQRMKKFWRK